MVGLELGDDLSPFGANPRAHVTEWHAESAGSVGGMRTCATGLKPTGHLIPPPSSGMRGNSIDYALFSVRMAAGIIFGHLNGLSLANLGVLANAIGAAKVQKRGTGLNVPTRAEVQAVLVRFGEDSELLSSKNGC